MKSEFDWAILDAINNAIRTVKAAPLVLGATSSGTGGPIGGFIGYLPQERISYDSVEDAIWALPISGLSLITNLNRIRYRLNILESGTFLDLDDTPNTYSGSAGKSVIVNPTADGLIFATISGGTGGGHVIQDEGVSRTQRTYLDFVGSGVFVTDDSINDRTIVTISGGGSLPTLSGSKIVITDVSGNITTDNELQYNSTTNTITIGEIPISIANNSLNIVADGLSASMFMWTHGSGLASFLTGMHSNGSFASQTASTYSGVALRLRGRFHDGSAIQNTSAEIRHVASQTHYAGGRGTDTEFWETDNDSTTLRRVFVVQHDGNVNIEHGKNYLIAGAGIPYTNLTSRPAMADSATILYNSGSAVSSSTFAGTVATLPGAKTFTYAVTSGNEDILAQDVAGTSRIAQLRLYNTTRGNNILIDTVNTGTNTIVCIDNVPANWVIGDVVTVASQTVSGGGFNWVDVEVKGDTFLNKSYVSIYAFLTDTGGAGAILRTHPFTTYAPSKVVRITTQSTQQNSFIYPTALISNVLSLAWVATGTGTFNFSIRQKEIRE